MPRADSTALTDAWAWTVVHTPQIRCAQIHASRGSLSLRMSSIPRNIVPEEYAWVTAPPSTVASMRRWPSMRVTGSMTIVLAMARLLSSLRRAWSAERRPAAARPDRVLRRRAGRRGAG